jgi:hypothetical protein
MTDKLIAITIFKKEYGHSSLMGYECLASWRWRVIKLINHLIIQRKGNRTMGQINCSIEQLPVIAAGLIREGMLFEVLVDDENALITITGY